MSMTERTHSAMNLASYLRAGEAPDLSASAKLRADPGRELATEPGTELNRDDALRETETADLTGGFTLTV